MAIELDPRRAAAAAGLGVSAILLGLLAGANPLLAIAGALALAFVVAVFSDLAVGLAIFVIVTFVDILPVGESPLLSAVKAAGALLAVAWLAVVTTRRRDAVGLLTANRALAAALVLFLAWAALSALWAETVSEALLATQRYGLNFLLFAIVFTAVRTKRDLVWVLAAFVIGAVFAALFGLASPPDPTEDLARVEAAGLNANDLATVLVAGLVLSLALISYARSSPALQLAAGAAAILCVYTLLFTLSRSGLVALGVALVGSLLIASQQRARAVIAALLIAATAIGYFAFLAPPEARERVTTFESGTGRTDIWTVGWRMFEDKPVLGVGVGNFREVSADYALSEPGGLERSDLVIDVPKQAHNVYLEALSELGIPGLILFGAIILLALRGTLRAARMFLEQRDRRMAAVARAVFAAQVGFLAAAFFASIEFNKQLWILLALGPALWSLARTGSGPGLPHDHEMARPAPAPNDQRLPRARV